MVEVQSFYAQLEKKTVIMQYWSLTVSEGVKQMWKKKKKKKQVIVTNTWTSDAVTWYKKEQFQLESGQRLVC